MDIRHFATVIALIFCGTTAGSAVDYSPRYTAPPVAPCGSEILVGLTIGDGDGCVTLTGYVWLGVGWGTDGLLSAQDGQIRAAAGTNTAVGPVAAVIGAREEWFSYTWDTPEPLHIDQAYLQWGDDQKLIVGYVPIDGGTIAKFDGDEPFDVLGTFIASDYSGVGTPDDIPVGGLSVQYVAEAGDLTLGLGLENLDGHRDYGGGSPVPASRGTLVGIAAIDGETFEGHIAAIAGGVVDGSFDALEVHSAATISGGPVRFRVAGAADGAGFWSALASGDFKIDSTTIAGTISASAFEGSDWSISIEQEINDALVLSIAGRILRGDGLYSSGNVAQLGVRAELTLGDDLMLSGEVGRLEYDDDYFPNDPVAYVKGKLSYDFLDDNHLGLSAVANTYGAYQTDLTLAHTIR